MANLLKKISPKNLVGDVKAVADGMDDATSCELYRIWGIAEGVQTGETQYGPWVAFTGQFGALNSVSGEEYKGVKAFLPEPMQTMLQNALADNDKVEFALLVHLKRRKDLAIGYEYIAEPIIDAQEADPLAHLKLKALPQLEAPKAPKPTKKAS